MDPWEEAFAGIGADFEEHFAPLLAAVTVVSRDPDDETALVTASGVLALKRTRRRAPFGAGGGELGADQSRFVFRASRIAATLKAGDTVEEADGTTWMVDDRGAELIALEQLWALNVSIKRA